MFFKSLGLVLSLIGTVICQSTPTTINVSGDAEKYVELGKSINISCSYYIPFGDNTKIYNLTEYLASPTGEIKWKAVHTGNTDPPFGTLVGQEIGKVDGTYIANNVPETLASRIQAGNASITSTSEDDFLSGSVWIQINEIILDDAKMNPLECTVRAARAEDGSRFTLKMYSIPTVTITPGMQSVIDLREPVYVPPVTNATEGFDEVTTAATDMEDGMESETAAEGTDNNTGDQDGNDLDYNNGISRKRRQVDSGVASEGESVEVAKCVVYFIYPLPSEIVFVVNGVDDPREVTEDDKIENADGTFTITKALTLPASADLNGQYVNCYVKYPDSSSTEGQVYNSNTDVVMIDVLYDTTETTMTIDGSTASEQNMNINTEFDISCTANGNPEPQNYEIVKEGDFEEIIGEEASMTYEITESTTIFCRTYTRNNKAINSNSITLTGTKIGAVTVTVNGENVGSKTFTTGSKLTLNCAVAYSIPQPQVKWTRPDGSTKTGNELVINSLAYNSKGTYRCTASNSAGEKSDEVLIEIEGKCTAQFKATIGSSIHTTSGHVRLECKTYGNPPCEVDFLPSSLVGSEKKKMDDPEYLADGSVVWSVTFDEFAPKAATAFTANCTAKNSHGMVYSNARYINETTVVEKPPVSNAGISTGVIILIIIIVVIVVVGVPVGCYYVQRRKKSSSKSMNTGKDADLESTNEEDEREKLNANSEKEVDEA